MRTRLNVWACVITGVVLALVIAGVFFGQRWQVRRHAIGLLELARKAESDGRVDRAISIYQSYLALVPTNTDARAEYGLLLDRHMSNPKDLGVVVGVFEDVLSAAPGRADVRERLAYLYARLGRLESTLSHLKELKAETSSDPGIVFLLGRCKEETGDLKAAETLYRRSLGLDPKPIFRSLQLSNLYRKMGKSELTRAEKEIALSLMGQMVALSLFGQADQTIDRMLAANPNDGLAYLARAQYRIENQFKDDEIHSDVSEAIRFAPKNPSVRLTAAQVAKDPATARSHLMAALAVAPQDERLYLAIAGVEFKDKKPNDAIAQLRRGIAALPGNERLLLAIAELQIQAGDGPETEKYADELARWKRAPEQVVLLRARAKMIARDWQSALAILLEGRPMLTTAATDLVTSADVLIGQCHQQIGEDDLALSAFRRAVAASPFRIDAQEGMARVLTKLGRQSEAVEQYRQLTNDPNSTYDVWRMYSLLKVAEYFSKAQGVRRGRDLKELEGIFAEVEKRNPNSIETLILRAEIQVADGQPESARELMRKAYADKPDDTALGMAIARLATRLGDREEAARVLAAMKNIDSYEWYLARLDALPTDGPAAESVIRAAENAAKKGGSPETRLQLITALAEIYARKGSWADSKRWCQEAARLNPSDIGVWLRAFDVAVQSNDRRDMEDAVQQVRRIEGGDGAFGHYLSALLHVIRPEDRSKDSFQKARDHLTAASLKRPNWSIVPSTRGYIADLETRNDVALTEYLRAVELGERRPSIIQRTVQLLCENRRFPEAERLIQQVQSQSQIRGQFDRLAAVVSLGNANIEKAVEFAGLAVTPKSQSYTDHIWKAEILDQAGKKDEATASYRKAVEVAGPVGAPRVALVSHLHRIKKTSEAINEISALPKYLKGKELDITTAQCEAAVGRFDAAAAAFQKAVATWPADVDVVRQACDFFEQSGDPKSAASALRHLLTTKLSPSDEMWTRRVLAGALATDSRYPSFLEAIRIIDQNLAIDPIGVTDRVVKARILATRLAHRKEALAQLDEARRRVPLSAETEYFRGQLLVDTGSWDEGRRVIFDVLSRAEARPQQLGFFVDRLIRKNELGDAEFWLARFEQAAPNHAGAARLRAILLTIQNRQSDAVERLKKMAPSKISNAEDRDLLRGIAELAEGIGREFGGNQSGPLSNLSEQLLALAAQDGRREDVLAYASALGRRGKLEKAMELCKKPIVSSDPFAVAVTLVGILYANPPLAESQLDMIEREIQVLLNASTPSANRDALLGTIHARRGRYAEAAEAFGRHAAAGGGAEAVNNRAYMLVLAGNATMALKLVESAIQEAGPTASLLDTRGVARRALGQLPEAIADGELAVEQEPTAVRCLHLAMAYQKGGREKDVDVALAKARKLLVISPALSPAEQLEFDGLKK